MIRGLRAGTTYRFSVRAVRRSVSSAPSPVHCHATMKTADKVAAEPVSVVTYNVCGTARGCGSWAKRKNAVLKQIDRSKPDVVTLQEIDRRGGSLLPHLRKRGFEPAVLTHGQALFYRRSRFDANAIPFVQAVCRDEPYVGPADVTQWSKPTHWDPVSKAQYVYVDGQWFVTRSTCPREESGRRSMVGTASLARKQTVTFAAFQDLRSGRFSLFVTTHLSHGRSRTAVRQRRHQTATLITKIVELKKGCPSTLTGGCPVVLTGDFNSDATRAEDNVGTALTKAGYRDTFQNSATYKNPQVNSFNGYRRALDRNERWGGHIDRLFTSDGIGATGWEVVARTAGGRYVGRWASDHNPVRVSLYLP